MRPLPLLLALAAALPAAEFDLTSAGYLGDGSDDDEVLGVAIQADGDVVVAASAGPDTPALRDAVLLGGATAQSRGVVLVLTPDGRSVKSAARLPAVPLDIALDAQDRIYVALGDAGGAALDARAGAWRWAVAAPVDPRDASRVGAVHRVDAAEDRIAFLSAAYGATGFDATPGQGQVLVWTATGAETARFATLGGRNANDLAFHPATRTLVVAGWRQTNDWWISGSVGGPVQIPVLHGLTYDGSTRWIGYDWGVDPTDLPTYLNRNGLFPDGTKNGNATAGNNMADARLYRIALGGDGAMVVTGHSAGGNHLYRSSATDLNDSTERAHPQISDLSPQGFVVRAKTDATGRARFVVLPDGAAAPSAAQVAAGTDAAGAAVPAGRTGVFDLVADRAGASAELTGLAPGTAWDVFIIAEDDAGNRTAVVKRDVTTPAVTWSDTSNAEGATAWTRTGSGTTRFTTAITAPGSVGWVVVPAGSADPSATQIAAGQDAGGATVPSGRRGTIACPQRGRMAGVDIPLAATAGWELHAVIIGSTTTLARTLAEVTAAPGLSRVSGDNAFNTGFTARVETNAPATGWFVVLPDGAAAPSADRIRAGRDAGGAPALAAGSVSGDDVLRAEVSGLAQNADYDLWWTAEGFRTGLYTPPVKGDVRTANDSTPPNWSSTEQPRQVDSSTVAVGVRFAVDESATVRWVRLPAGAPTPTPDHVWNGRNAAGAVVPAGSLGVDGGRAATITIDALAPASGYRIALVAENRSGLRQGGVIGVDVATLGTTSDADWVVAPVVDRIGTRSAVLRFKNGSGGTGWWIVRPAGASAPTAAEVKAGASTAFTWKLPAMAALRGLTPATAYRVWVVAADGDGVEVGPTAALFTTAAADAQAPGWAPATLATYDFFSSYAGASSQHLGFAARYDISRDHPVFAGGQGVVARLSVITPNTLHAEGGGVAGGATGTLMMAGVSAYGLPFWPNEVDWRSRSDSTYNPFGFADYTGGAFLIGLRWSSTNPGNPLEKWFNRRAYTTRLAYGRSRAVAMRVVDGVERIVWGGSADLSDGPMRVVGAPVQTTPGYGARDGFLVVHIPGQDGVGGGGGGDLPTLATPITGPVNGGGGGATIRLRNRQAPDRLAMNLDGDGQADDLRFLFPWSLTEPLLPASGTGATYGGPLIYGGAVIDILNNQVADRTLDAMGGEAYGTGKTLRLSLKEGIDASNADERIRSRVAFLFRTEDLLDADGLPLRGATDRLSFDTASEFAFTLRKGNSRWKDYNGATTGAPAVDLAIRFVVRNGNRLYVSKDVRNWEGRGTSEWSTHVLAFASDSDDGEWAPWNPAEGQPGIFNAATATFASMDFQDITAIGWYAEDTGWRRHHLDPVRWWNSNDNQNGIFYEWDGVRASLARNAATNRPPEAAFTIRDSSLTPDDRIVRVGDPVTVDGSASADPEGRLGFLTWDFGDGFQSSGTSETHSYTAAGRYPITLTVWDDQRVRTTLTRHVDVVRGDADAATAAALVACWSGEMATGGSEYFIQGDAFRIPAQDLDGDGSADDHLVSVPLAGFERPISPASQDGTRLIGGWRIATRNRADGSRLNDWPRAGSTGNNNPALAPLWDVNGVRLHGLSMGYNGNGDAARVFALFAIPKESFLGGRADPAVRVALDGSSVIRIGPFHTWEPATPPIRLALRNGGQWYVDARAATTATTYANNTNNGGAAGNPVLVVAQPAARSWLPFDPAGSMAVPVGTGAPVTFDDVTAVGVVVGDGATWIQPGNVLIAGMELQATSDLAAQPAPVATFTASPASGGSPLAVILDAGATTGGLERTYAWDFGDGVVTAPTSASAASHTYTGAGTYAAVLTVADAIGRTATTARSITVTGTPPTIRLRTTALTVSEGRTAVVRLERSGSPAGTVSVRLRTVDGSARTANGGGQGPDYGAADARVTWASGELGDRFFSIPVLADSTADPGESFSVQVLDPYNGAIIAGATVATIAVGDRAPLPPTILADPVSVTVLEGSILRLQVSATGAELAYRWRRNGVDLADGPSPSGAEISDSGSAELRIAGVRPGDAGAYACKVRNLAGAVVSGAASVAVDAVPTVAITSPATDRVALPDLADTLVLGASASDPEGTAPVLAWEQRSGPAGGTAVIADPSAATTSVRFPVPGTYVLRVTASDGAQDSHAEVTVHAGAVWAEGIAGPLRTTGSGVTVTGSAVITAGSATIASSWTEHPGVLNGWYRHALLGGDFTVTVRVASVDQSSQQWTHYGILATADAALPATAPFAFMGSYTGQGAVAQVRPFVGGTVIQNRNGGGPWFRLVRRGDLFTGFRSADGVAWIQQMDAVVVPMGQSVRVGLIVNAQNNGSTISIADAAKRMTVVFDRLSGLPDVDGAPDVGVGADRTVAVGVPFMVTGTARDDGGTPQVSWSRISGPGSAIIARPATASTRVTLDQAGVHVLRFTGDDGTARTFAELTVTAGNPPAITTTALPVVRIGDAVAIALAADHAPTGWSASGLPPGLAIAAADGLISGSPSAVGSFAVTATAANALGRDVRTWVLTVEDLPDLPPVITSVAPTAVRTGATVAITGSGFAGGATVRIGGTTAVADWISVSRLIATIPAGLAGQVRVVVANGTATAAWSGRIEVDDVPPPRPATAAIAGNGTPAPVLSGTAAAAVAVAIRIDGSERLRLALAGGGAWSWTPALTVGTHVVEVQAFDAAGNASPLSPPVTVTVAAPPGPVDPGSGGGGGGGCGLGSGLGLILIGLFLARRRR